MTWRPSVPHTQSCAESFTCLSCKCPCHGAQTPEREPCPGLVRGMRGSSMTDLTIDEIRAAQARCEAATPGPWDPAILADGVRHLERNESEWYQSDIANLPGRQAGDGGKRDGEFIAAARTDVPTLAAMAEKWLRAKALLEEYFVPGTCAPWEARACALLTEVPEAETETADE